MSSNMTLRNSEVKKMQLSEKIQGVFLGFQPAKYGQIIGLRTEDGKIIRLYASLSVESQLFPCDIGKNVGLHYVENKQTAQGGNYQQINVYVEENDAVGQSENKTPF